MAIDRRMDKEDVVHARAHTHTHTHTHTEEYYSVIKKNVILSFVTTWMALEDIMLSEISQKGQIPYDFTYTWYLKHKTNEQTKQKQAYRRANWYLPEGERRDR